MKKVKIMSEVLFEINQFELSWQHTQPDELREIERLVIDLSKSLYHYRHDEQFCKSYAHDICNEIKQLAHDYQRKNVYKK